MGAFTSVLNLVRPSGAVSGVEGGLERGVTESSKVHSTRTDQASHGSSQGSDTTKAHRSMRTKEYISNHMVLEETIRDGASDGWPKAIAQQLLRENPRIYRLFSYENDRLYVHMAQKIEAKSKILRLIDDKSAALTELQAPAGAQVRQQGNAGLEAKRLYTRLAPEQQLTLKQWVEQAQHHPEQQTRMRQELAQEEDQCFKELGILLQPYRKTLSCDSQSRTTSTRLII
ncbi:hypothetical protein Micbo1qcDRAFT_52872 [Microdochium bolleyi]|uniref:Uncharacterized protein n=1 Tax=Microdochium bolleyi TaxID=196109 RepID=A0A136J7D4_9PEZI|nr:hypothetical protein Micbo1qcDRAFT_52872 [Microdochium bolleyi]